MTAAVIEVERTRVEPGPITAGDTSGEAVAAHGEAGRRSDFACAGAGGKVTGRGRCRGQGIGGERGMGSGAAGGENLQQNKWEGWTGWGWDIQRNGGKIDPAGEKPGE